LDAIGCAGDIKANGKADDVIVMRVVDGQSKLYHLNLQDGSVFSSQAFYLLKGDIVYVQPRKGKSLLQRAPMNIQLNNDVTNLNSTQGHGLYPTY
jgi:polysaccharide export outer membrane protein